MRIIILGCTQSTRRIIQELSKQKNYKIVAIFALADHLSYKKSRFVPLDDIALQNKAKLYKIADIKDEKIIGIVKRLKTDVIIECGWSQVVPSSITAIPKKGCIGIHNSYLPKNQGAASLNWALIKKRKQWGVTLFYLTEKIDQGDTIDQEKFFIEKRDDIQTLFDKADFVAVRLLIKNLPLIDRDNAQKRKQEKYKATYLPKRTPEDGRIDWQKSNDIIHALIKALTKPYPGAFTLFHKKKVIIWKSRLIHGNQQLSAGKVIGIHKGKGVVIATGKGNILLERIQMEDGIEMWADDFAKAYRLDTSNSFY